MRKKRRCRGGSAAKHWRNYDLITGSNPCNLIDIATSISVINHVCLSSSIISQIPRGVNKSNLKQIQWNLRSLGIQKNLFLANVNSRSLRNKVAVFENYIVTNQPDLCIIIETWLNENNCLIRNEICLDGFVFKDHSRENRRDGGTGVLGRKALRPEKVSGGQTRFFEYSEYAIRLDGKKYFIHDIYRPPYSERNPVSTNVSLKSLLTTLERVLFASSPSLYLEISIFMWIFLMILMLKGFLLCWRALAWKIMFSYKLMSLAMLLIY